MPYFYTKQKTIIASDPDDFDNRVNKLLYSLREYLDVKMIYDTVRDPTHNDKPIHIAYITWKEEVLVDGKKDTKRK